MKVIQQREYGRYFLFKTLHKYMISALFLSCRKRGKEQGNKNLPPNLKPSYAFSNHQGEFLVTKETITGSFRFKYNICVVWLENAKKAKENIIVTEIIWCLWLI